MFKNTLVKSVIVIALSILYVACIPQVKKPVSDKGPFVRVLLATISSRDSLGFTGSFALQSEEARYEFGERNRNLYIQPLLNGLQLYNQNRNLLYRQYFPIILEPLDKKSRFIYLGKEYAGSVYFQPATDNSVYLINKILLEKYLRGVVPAEIPATSREDYEAIKAQAICARTYALKKIEKNKDGPYDLTATVEDQVYDGYSRYSELADQAVVDTRAVIIAYHGQPATVYYHSTCGGRTEAVENIFPDGHLPYLQGSIDAVGDIFSCRISPLFRWEETRTFTALDSKFSMKYGRSLLNHTVSDTLQLSFNLKVLKRNSTGRVSELQVTYADTSLILSGYTIREFLSSTTGKYLPSNLFYLTQPDDSTLTIHGGGYGHGVGMCQFGALNMARSGFKHYHILSKYFPYTKLLRKY